MSQTESVLDHHLEMIDQLDLDGVMSDYAEDAVLITEEETYRGHEEIREMFDSLLGEFEELMMFSLETRKVEDECAYIVWEAETAETEYEYASDTFIIRDGEIVIQTLAANATPKS